MWQAVQELAGQGTTVLLTTQYLDEAEQLADRIAILHEGRIIANGTLAELKRLLPPGHDRVRREAADPGGHLPGGHRRDRRHGPADLRPHRRLTHDQGSTMTTHFLGDTAVLTGRTLRHVTRSVDTIITTAIMPIAIMLLFVYVFGGAIDTGTEQLRRLPAARDPADHDRVRDRLHRRPALHRPVERDLRAVPVDADRPLERAVGARADLAGRQPRLARRRRGRRRS